MATINLTDWVEDAAGVGVVATVNVWTINVDGTIGAKIGSDVTTTSGARPAGGRYQFTNVTLPASGKVAVKITAGADVRWRFGDIKFQAEEISGPNGVAPLQVGSVTSTLLQAGAGTDTVIGSRTADQAIATAFATSGTLTQLLSWIAKAMKAITGETNWYTTPTAGTLLNKVRNGGGAPRLTVATTKGSPAESGEVKLVTSGTDKGVWVATTGSVFTQIAELDAGTGGTGTASDSFSTIAVGGTNVVADGPEDTLNLIAGTNITLTPSASGDSITIAAASGGSGSTNATTVNGIAGTRFPEFASTPIVDGVTVPSPGTTQMKVQSGSQVVSWNGTNYTLSLSGPITGYAAIIVVDGDWGAHPTIPAMTVSVDTSITGSSPAIACRLNNATTGAAVSIGNLRLDYIIFYW